MSEPIRVLQVVTTMNRGGLETMLMNYYRNIDRSKVQFDFIEHRTKRSAYDDEIESLGGCIYRLPKLVPWSISYRRTLKTFFQSHPEYQIVHVHQDCLSSVALKAAKTAGVPIRIAHSHNSTQDRNIKYPIKFLYKHSIPKHATSLFSCGKDAGDWMFDGSRYHILNNAISALDYRFDSVIREKMRTKLSVQNQFVIGLTARFSPQKNHSFLIDVFHEIVHLNPNATLLLVGDGELRNEIESKIQKYHLEKHVILTGTRTDIPDLLQAMDVFVMPSNYEGLSLAIVEAQASGLPCFISDKVPTDCKLTNLVQQLSLDDSAKIWANEILKVQSYPRKNMYHEIVAAGFDIQKNAHWLEEFYINLY